MNSKAALNKTACMSRVSASLQTHSLMWNLGEKYFLFMQGGPSIFLELLNNTMSIYGELCKSHQIII